jgi:hypothetical protein
MSLQKEKQQNTGALLRSGYLMEDLAKYEAK